MINAISELRNKLLNDEPNWFDNTILLIILISAVLLGIETNHEFYLANHKILVLIDSIILGIFTFEVFFKMAVHGKKPWRYFFSGWNIFDFSIVVLSFLPLFLSSDDVDGHAIVAARVFRLFRAFRVLRIITHLRPLKAIIEALVKSLPKMFNVVLLMLIIFYVYAVIGVFVFGFNDPIHFGSLSDAMLTLFRGIMGDWTEILKIQLYGSDVYGYDGFESMVRQPQTYPTIAPIYFISFVVIGSLVILNFFIGIIVSELENSKTAERSGKEALHYRKHTVILGWSQKIFPILSELIEANRSRKTAQIVILSEQDKSSLEIKLQSHVRERFNTEIFIRTGSPLISHDLTIVNVKEARSVIILPTNEFGVDDYHVMKVLLSIRNSIEPEIFKKLNVASIFKTQENLRIASSLVECSMASITYDELVPQIMAQTILQPGLSRVLDELIGYSGNEIYIFHTDETKERQFREIMLSYPHCIPIGIYREDGEVVINPHGDCLINENDDVVLISEEDSLMNFEYKEINKDKFRLEETKLNIQHEDNVNLMIFGWNEKAKTIISEISATLQHEAKIKIITCEKMDLANVFSDMISLEVSQGDYTDRDFLESLNWQELSHVLILSDVQRNTDTEKADTVVLITHTLVSEILADRGIKNIPLTAEILSIQNKNIIHKSQSDDIIISEDLNSRILAQFSEEPRLKDVIYTLLGNNGTNFRVYPITDYISKEKAKEISFADLMILTSNFKQIAIGVMNKTNDEVIINPPKNKKFHANEEYHIIVVT